MSGQAQITARISKEMKTILKEYSEKTGLGISQLNRIALCLLFQEFRILEESLKDINKTLCDMCPIYEKRYSNFAFYPLRRVIHLAPKEDRSEILLAIEKVKNNKKLKKEKDLDSLRKLNLEGDGYD